MPAKHKTIRIDPGPAGECPPLPDYLEPSLQGDWQSVFDHLSQQGTYYSHVDPRLMEAWVTTLARLRDAHKILRTEGSFVEGKPHPATAVVLSASGALTKIATALGVNAGSRTVLMAAASAKAAQTAATTGAWAQAASAPTAAPAPVKRARKAA